MGTSGGGQIPKFWPKLPHINKFNKVYLCAFTLSNGSNWEVNCIIPIFAVIFGPPGYRFNPTDSLFILRKYHHIYMHHALSWMYFCWYFASLNDLNYLHNINIWGILVNIWVYDHLGCPHIGWTPTILPFILNVFYS